MHTKDCFGIVTHGEESTRPTDYLYRVSLKCLIRNTQGEILVNKEVRRTYWDLPGGGMDHGEDIKTAIAREMKEEVNLEGDFTYKILALDEPAYLGAHNFWQIRLIFELTPQNMHFSAGDDSDEVTFLPPSYFKASSHPVEQSIHRYLLSSLSS